MTHNPRLGKYEAYDPEPAPLDVERVRLFFHMQQEAGVYGSPVCLHLHDRTPPCVERANQFVAEYARGAVPALQATPEPPDALVDRIGTRMQATGEGEPND